MNTNLTVARSILGRSLAVAVLGLAALAATPARADDVPTKVVQIADLNLSSEPGREALVLRVKSAAASICGARDDRDLSRNEQVVGCRQSAIKSAIAQINDPALAAWYAARTGGSSGARVASVK